MGLGLVFLLAGTLFWGLGAAIVQAGPQDFDDIKTATYRFESKSKIIGVFGDKQVEFIDKDPYPADDILNYIPRPNPFCGSVDGITLTNDNAFKPGNTAAVTALVELKYAPEIEGRPGTPTGCIRTPDRTVTLTEAAKAEAPAAETVEEDTSDCAASDDTGLEWLLCPITTAISKAADGLNGEIEDQLNFDINGNLANKDEGYVAWSLVKNIVSALIVIIMLVMVIGQAVGGPFDAYTIKKLLPKLVIAVIAMQLSWEICKWLISLSNSAGEGVKQLMLAPFGGGGNMDLNSILNRLSETWAVGSQGIIPALLVGGGIIAFISLPGTFVAIFGLFIGIFAAFMVLLFRNVLIVALTIFSPLAFLAWTLPGTQSYWKLWRENFTKLLLMFPLIIGMLYVGRIFAWIIADAGAPGPVDYITILVAYFGPYFLIFKSYKWGGSLMSAAGTGIAGARRGITQANSGWLKDRGEKFQGYMGNKYNIATRDSREKYAAAAKTEDRINRLKEVIAKRQAEGRGVGQLENRLGRMQERHKLRAKEAIEAQKEEGRFRRAGLRIAAGKPIPSSRQQLETIARGSQYKQELVDQKKALIHTDFVEQLNSGASVGDAKRYIRDKYGWQKDEFTDRAFNNWLVDTNSGMELEDTEWRTAGGSRPDLAKSYGFMGMMNADPERYRKVAGWLPELQPFNQALGGGPKAEDFLVDASGRRGKRLAEVRRSNPPLATRLEAGGTDAHQLATLLADDARHTKIFQNLEHTSDISTWRPGQLQMMADNIQKMKAAGIETSQAETELKQIFNELKASRTPEAMSTLQRLMGGKKSARKAVNTIMQDDKWLEDSLNVPVTTSQGVTRITALPSENELREDEVQSRVRSAILDRATEDPRSNPQAHEIARAIGEDAEYAVEAQGISQASIQQIVHEVGEAAKNSHNLRAITNFNNILDLAIKNAGERAQRVVRDAVARNLPAADIRTLEGEAANELRRKIAELQALKIEPPDEDPTQITISHEPQSPPPTRPPAPQPDSPFNRGTNTRGDV